MTSFCSQRIHGTLSSFEMWLLRNAEVDAQTNLLHAILGRTCNGTAKKREDAENDRWHAEAALMLMIQSDPDVASATRHPWSKSHGDLLATATRCPAENCNGWLARLRSKGIMSINDPSA